MADYFKQVIGGKDLEENFDYASRLQGKINFIFPTIENIYCNTGGTVPFTVSGTTYTVPVGDLNISDLETSSTENVDFKIFVDGEAPLASTPLKAAAFSGQASVTNAIPIFLELPSNDFANIYLKVGSGQFAALTADNVFLYEGKTCVLILKGVWDVEGTITETSATFALNYGAITKTYEFDYTDTTLET